MQFAILYTDHDQFVKVVKMLRPGYVPPSCKAVAGPLLDAVTEQLSEQMRADLQGCDNATFFLFKTDGQTFIMSQSSPHVSW